MIKGFTPRLYQERILATVAEKNTLVVLPTGLGKTNVFLMLAALRLKRFPQSKILLLGPTKPLIDQYHAVFMENFELPEEKLAVLTGLVPPAKREELWNRATVIFSTPQGLENDLITKRISFEDVSLLGFDEAHRAVGDYSYVWIARQYHEKAKYPRIIALTASPGSDIERINEVCGNLFIEEVEVRTEEDADVRPYVQEIDIEWVTVELPRDFLRVKKLFEACLHSKLQEIRKYGYVRSVMMNRTELLKLQGALHQKLAQGEKDFRLLKSLSLLAEVMKAYHALELVETQSIGALHAYLEKLQNDARTGSTKAVKNLVADSNFRNAFVIAEKLYHEKIEHPKLATLAAILKKELAGMEKAMVFTQYRDSAASIHACLEQEKISSAVFVGQTKKGATGMSQKEQKAMLQQFRDGEFHVLIATSIGEEGLDIPNVELVVFYEPVPSAIRQIQRRGRTGRHSRGKVIILMAKDTRDQAFRYVAWSREKKTHRILRRLKDELQLKQRPQRTLETYEKKEEAVKIIADTREKTAGAVKQLMELGADVRLQKLHVGDYLCSSRVGVELKTAEDFVNSIIDGRLLQQVQALKANFERPVLLVEGWERVYSARGVHPNAIRGMLAAIAIGYGVPVLYTADSTETAALLLAMAKREQENAKDFAVHGSKKTMTLQEQQEYIVSALPGVEQRLAKELLQQFHSVAAVMAASEDELQQARLIGEKKAKEIRRVLDSAYED